MLSSSSSSDDHFMACMGRDSFPVEPGISAPTCFCWLTTCSAGLLCVLGLAGNPSHRQVLSPKLSTFWHLSPQPLRNAKDPQLQQSAGPPNLCSFDWTYACLGDYQVSEWAIAKCPTELLPSTLYSVVVGTSWEEVKCPLGSVSSLL